ELAGTTDVASAAGASVIVVADRAHGADRSEDEAVQLVRRAAQLAPGAVILCAAAPHRPVLDRVIVEFRLNRRRVFGSAPEAMASGARALVALAAHASPRDVSV